VHGVDLLQSLVKFSYHEGLLTVPIPCCNDYPIIQYADDTIIVLLVDPFQLAKFRDILGQYASFTGLNINYNKSSMIPINVTHDEVVKLAKEFGC
jgi:hypothetical protein